MVATCLCAFVVIPLFSTDLNLGLFKAIRIVAHNLLLQNSFPHTDAFAFNPYPRQVNGSLWSIPFEFECYMMVAGLGIAGLVTRGKLLVSLTVGIMLLRVALDLAGARPHAGFSGYVLLWAQILPSFLLGMVVYSYRNGLPRDRRLLVALLAAAGGLCWIGAGNVLLAPALAYAVFYAAYSTGTMFDGAAKFGDFSYGCYLYAFVIQQMIQSEIGDRLGLAAFIAISMALSLIAGVLSWHLVEKHFKERTRHPISGQTEKLAASIQTASEAPATISRLLH
jgi:peptidoglycan/LPS O-acetylase OafA/YrhL